MSEAQGGRDAVAEDPLYRSQKAFFRDAYLREAIGWPRAGASRLVLESIRKGLVKAGSSVLEIGCGEGRNLIPFRTMGCNVVGMDYLREPLESARSRSSGGAGTVRLVQGDLFRLPFRAGAFDVVLDWGVFHHLKRRERTAYSRWIGSILVPDGLFLLAAFSEKFRHDPAEHRKQAFKVHRGHYDVFFDEKSFPRAMGKEWTLLWSGEEDQGDELSFYRIGAFRKGG
jgi:cyclopropane fatty-acyl-phospholipid synthase-like methyltransferase